MDPYPLIYDLAAPAWWLGAALCAWRVARGERRHLLTLAVVGVLALGGLAFLLDPTPPGWLLPLVDLRGVRGEAQAAAMALIALLHRPAAPTDPPWRGALFFPLLAVQGAAGLLTALVVTGSGALEPGAPRRGWLALALLMAGLGGAIEAWSLRVWMAAGRWLPLGGDDASLLVDAGEQVLRGGAWLTLLVWATRPGNSVVADSAKSRTS